MKALRIAGQAPPVSTTGPVWLGYGFRPFFLLASLWAFLLIAAWVPVFLGRVQLPLALPIVLWHAHEMLFGFASGVVAGFLLTAVPNWTGIPTPRGPKLGLLAGLWLAGRTVTSLAGPEPAWPLVAIDVAFLPVVTLVLAYPLVRARQLRNLIFLPVLTLLSGANWLVWYHHPAGLKLALYSLLLMVVLIGGRVIPFFIERGLSTSVRRFAPIEVLAPLSLLVLAGFDLMSLPGMNWVRGIAALVQLTRLGGWVQKGVWRVPLLWILVVSYACLPLGLLLQAGGAPGSAGLHMLTVGCLGCMILGMMARVSLGHTGRELKPARATVAAFFLCVAAAVVRSLGPLLMPTGYTHALWCSALLWCLAFLLFLRVYFVVLTRPRADGQPG